MMKQFYLITLILLTCNLYAAIPAPANPLPNWIDHTRETSDQLPPKHFLTPSAPPESFRLTAEYEKAQAVVLGWNGYLSMLQSIAQIASSEANVEIWAAWGPAQIPSVPVDKYVRIPCRLNTVWMRDYGPFGIIEETGAVGVVDTVYRHFAYRRNDDLIPSCIAGNQNLEVFSMDLILDGGNLMVDRHGNLFMTKRTYLWNNKKTPEEIDNMLKEYFNVKTIHALDYAGYPNNPADGTGHIDMFVKLLNDDTVLIAEAEEEPFKSNCQKAYNYFQGIKSPSGAPYKILRSKGWFRNGAWYTYTNSLIVNNVVLMPSFSTFPNEEQRAIEAYKQGIPGTKVHPIDSNTSILSGGAIHCVTQLIPKGTL